MCFVLSCITWRIFFEPSCCCLQFFHDRDKSDLLLSFFLVATRQGGSNQVLQSILNRAKTFCHTLRSSCFVNAIGKSVKQSISRSINQFVLCSNTFVADACCDKNNANLVVLLIYRTARAKLHATDDVYTKRPRRRLVAVCVTKAALIADGESKIL
jgi:hypothetical protein